MPPQRPRLGEHCMDKPQSACLPCTLVMIRLKPYGGRRSPGRRHKLESFSVNYHVFCRRDKRTRTKQTRNIVFWVFLFFQVLCIFSDFDTDARLSFIVLHTDCVRGPHFSGSKRSHMLCRAERGSKVSHPARQPESKLPARKTSVCTCQFVT